jgi:oxygen-independent coproporphyrinogen-3 oxidase
MDATIKQFDKEIERFELERNSIESVFIGGGTPSTITQKLYKPLFEKLAPYLKKDIEVTTEANPNSASKKWLEGMRELGVNRVSFGVQSFDESKLEFLNRSHSKQMAIKAVEDAKNVGFEHISIDLIYATALDSKELLKRDLDTAFLLPIDHLSAYALTLEEGTKFFTMANVKKDDEEFANWIREEIIKRGFNQYEVSNFGKYESFHNKGYWRYLPYIGIGAGAVGFLKNRRFYPSKDIQEYINDPLYRDIEELSDEDIKKEKILLGLRSTIGFESSILNEKERKKADFLVSEKKLKKDHNKYYSNDLFLADEITLYIIL